MKRWKPLPGTVKDGLAFGPKAASQICTGSGVVGI